MPADDSGTASAHGPADRPGPAAPLQPLGPWNPGITSTLPRRLFPLATVLDPQNAAMSVPEIVELADVSGLPKHVVSELRPERLVLHDVLVRVMTEISIDDGPEQGDLGVEFRRVVSTLMERHLCAHMPAFAALYAQARCEIERVIDERLAALQRPSPAPHRPADRPSGWRKLFRRPRASEAPAQSSPLDGVHELQALDGWLRESRDGASPLCRACSAALHKSGRAILARQGRLAGRSAILKRVATALAANEHGADVLSASLEPHFRTAIAAEGLRVLPSQSRPIVMNTKGASASGKSTLRPRQRALAERIGVSWGDFALISPDIWRKQLLDYAALGAERRWAGTLTAHEVEIIDRKLDRHVTARAMAGRRTHLLIDRFRFDSFAPDGAEDDATQLLTRFGSEVYMFFVVTPPEATVERSWHRGERVGRYKAVDDLLAHNVEAYTGIPGLFFRWAASQDKVVHYEFLDNSVPQGQHPRTIAFGQNGAMTVLRVTGLVDIDRFRQINIAAETPGDVYAGAPRATEPAFLRDCIRQVPRIVFARSGSGEIYAEVEGGRLTYWRADMAGTEEGELLLRLVGDPPPGAVAADRSPTRRIERGETHTLGAWGGE